MPATRPDVLPPIQVGAWLRAGGVFQGSDPSKVNDWRMDNAYAELHAGGKIHQKVSVTLNLNANMASSRRRPAHRPGQSAGVDHGRHHLVRPDGRIPHLGRPPAGPRRPRERVRSVLHDPVELPRVLDRGRDDDRRCAAGRRRTAATTAPSSGATSRAASSRTSPASSTTSTLTTSPLFSGRVRLALWDPEPGFWGNGSYFGDKDLLSIGVGGQFQKNGSRLRAKDWAEVNVDVLVEKKLGGGSFVTGEGRVLPQQRRRLRRERLVVRARGLRDAPDRPRQHPADGPLPVGED